MAGGSRGAGMERKDLNMGQVAEVCIMSRDLAKTILSVIGS
jgi:hypothetical protein